MKYLVRNVSLRWWPLNMEDKESEVIRAGLKEC